MGFSNVCMSLFLDGSRIMAAEKGSPFFLRFYFVKRQKNCRSPSAHEQRLVPSQLKKVFYSCFPKARSLITSPARINPAAEGTKRCRELRGGMSHQGAVRLSQQEKAPVLGNKPPCSVLSPSF